MSANRINWADYAKGLCIILFVTAQSVTGYAQMTGQPSWMGFAAAWTVPVVVPTLFILSGLFVKRTLFGSKSTFFDRKVLRFAYFYLVWLVVQTVILHALGAAFDPMGLVNPLLLGLVQPASGLWIIPMLALFHAATWLLRFVPSVNVLVIAAVAQILHAAGLINTGWLVIDAAAQYFVFFYAGYQGAPLFRQFADRLGKGFSDVPIALVIWATVNTVLVAQNTAGLPVVSLVLGFAGAFAFIAISTMLARQPHGTVMQYIGRMHLVIYTAYFLPMTAAQVLLARSGLMPEAGLTSIAIGVVAVILPLGFHQLVRRTPLKALYRRPTRFRLKGAEQGRAGQLIAAAHDTIEEA